MTNNKSTEFTVRVTLKHVSKFKIKYERQGEFKFCAQSAQDARAIAGHHVKGSVSTIDTTRMVEIVGAVPVSKEVFPLKSPPLKSCREYASEIAELEFA